MAECTIASSDQATVIQLTQCDIPGAFLSEPHDARAAVVAAVQRYPDSNIME